MNMFVYYTRYLRTYYLCSFMFVYSSIYLEICLSIILFLWEYVCLFFYLSGKMFVYSSIFMGICLSILDAYGHIFYLTTWISGNRLVSISLERSGIIFVYALRQLGNSWNILWPSSYSQHYGSPPLGCWCINNTVNWHHS